MQGFQCVQQWGTANQMQGDSRDDLPHACSQFIHMRSCCEGLLTVAPCCLCHDCVFYAAAVIKEKVLPLMASVTIAEGAPEAMDTDS